MPIGWHIFSTAKQLVSLQQLHLCRHRGAIAVRICKTRCGEEFASLAFCIHCLAAYQFANGLRNCTSLHVQCMEQLRSSHHLIERTVVEVHRCPAVLNCPKSLAGVWVGPFGRRSWPGIRRGVETCLQTTTSFGHGLRSHSQVSEMVGVFSIALRIRCKSVMHNSTSARRSNGRPILADDLVRG